MIQVVSITGWPSSTSSGNMPNGECRLSSSIILRMVGSSMPIFELVPSAYSAISTFCV